MRYTEIRSTGVHLPEIVFGTSSLGNLYRQPTDETKLEIVGQMLEHVPGTVALDSAGKYGAGLALEWLGRALKHYDVPQDRVVISNKLGWRRIPLETEEPTFEPEAWVGLEHDAVQDISYDGILRCWEEGIELLGGYEARMVSVHDPDEYLAASTDEPDRESRWQDIFEAYRALRELRESGKASAIGVGAKDWRVSKRLVEECDLDWVMLACAFTIMRHEPELIEFIESLGQRGIAVINSAVFHGGFLTGGEFFDYRAVNENNPEDAGLFQYRNKLNAACEQFNLKPAEACVAFGVSPPAVAAIALNTSRPIAIANNALLPGTHVDEGFWQLLKDQNLIQSDLPFLSAQV